MSEPPLKKKRSTILDFFQRMSHRNKTNQAVEGNNDSKGTQEAKMADSDTSETDMKRKKQQGSVSETGKGKNVNKNSESHAAKHSQGNKTNQTAEGNVDSKDTQEAKMADTYTDESDRKKKEQPGSVSETGKGKNVNKNSESHAAKHSQGNKTNQTAEGNVDSKDTQEAKMADTYTDESDRKKKEQPGSVSETGKGKNVNKNSEPHAANHSQAKSITQSTTTVETDESSPGPDDDTCEQESEDWPAVLNTQSTDNFLSSHCAIPNKKPSPKKDGSQAWKGIPVNVMKKMPTCEDILGPLKNSDSHAVLFQTSYEYKEDSPCPPKPYPHYKDRWDHYHVRMPCSNQNEFPVQEKHGKKIARRWDIITRVLSQDIKDINDLEAAIGTYNHRYFDKWDFETLHYFFTHDLNEEGHNFFSKTMKKMQKLALNLPDLCSCPIPLLKKSQSKSVTFSQQQIASLLANAFFCTFPQRNTKQHFSEFSKFPSINFSSLFTGKPDPVKMEKLKCILHYFTRICDKTPCGTVTITRMHKTELPDWDEMETLLSGLHVSSEGTIEDDGEGMLQVDFANKYLGGGVLSHGCVQEEIRFLICPEMIISRLITEELSCNEALVMRGCERFSDYEGYSSTFKWKRSYMDETRRDKWGRIFCEVVAIDALVFRNYKSQFQRHFVKRELNKAFCGFSRSLSPEHLPAVCTGNWGCGAFGGDRRLKALIQLMAAAQAKRDVCYFTFDDEKLRDDLHQIHSYLTETNTLTIGDLLKIIEQYRKNVILKSQGKPDINIFEFILRTFDGSLENTDEDTQSSNEMRFQKESGNESSSSSIGATDGVTVNVEWDSETNASSSPSTSKISTSRQNSQEAQSSK